MLVFDTHQYIKNLMESGVPQEQAEVHADELKNIITQDLATKQDLGNTELRLNAKIDSSAKELKHEINLLKWMFGFIFASILSLMVKAFFG